ncbi:MAG TPA: hypothetical protein EYP34_12880 [Chromatiaceae bacterium]|nr:hypothetical protein [Chromatiaceae bacterium]
MKAMIITLLAALLVPVTNAEALEPFDPAKATRWPGVETVEPEEAGIGRKIEDVPFFQLYGQATSLYKLTGDMGTVIVVRDPDCPVSVRYGPRISKMAHNYSNKGFSFAFIYLNEHLDVNRLQKDAANLRAPAVKIGRGSFAIASALDVKSTGEVFVLDSENHLVYRGAIDDQYGFGYTQDAPTHNYLRNALDARLKNMSIHTPATMAPGCAIDADPKKDDFLPVSPDSALS